MSTNHIDLNNHLDSPANEASGDHHSPEVSSFRRFAGNNSCPLCLGEGSYMYDENHGKICERCCTHPDGFAQLDPEYWPHLSEVLVCRFGCGKQVKVVDA